MPPRKRTLPPRGGGGQFLKTAESAERDAEALRLRSRGMSLSAIAAQLGYSDGAGVNKALNEAVTRVMAPSARLYFEQQMLTLDDIMERCYAVLDAEHPLVSDGQIIRDDDGRPLNDPDMALKATDRILRVLERRAKLLGLDAAVKLDHTIHEVSEQDRELAEILREARVKMAVEEQKLNEGL